MKIIMQQELFYGFYLYWVSSMFDRQTGVLPRRPSERFEMTLRVLRTSPRPAVSRPPAHDALPTEARSAQRVLARL